jgi:thiol-disulfide isomerase/thioredoxin
VVDRARISPFVRLAVPLLLSGCAAAVPANGTGAPPAPPSRAPEPVASAAPSGEPAAVAPSTDGPAWLGVELGRPAPGEAGVLVKDVMPGSPAEKSGLAVGDRILRVDSEEVTRAQDVVRIVSSHRGGDRVGLALVRGGADRLIPVVLAARPDADDLLKLSLGDGVAPAWRPLAPVRGSVPASLSELRGRVVVMDFWASWCVPCRLTIPTLNAWHDRYGAQGLTVVGVTMDSPEVALEAALELGIDYPVLSDPDGETTRVYKAYALPTLFVIDRTGKIRVASVGYSSAGLEKTERLLSELLAAPR